MMLGLIDPSHQHLNKNIMYHQRRKFLKMECYFAASTFLLALCNECSTVVGDSTLSRLAIRNYKLYVFNVFLLTIYFELAIANTFARNSKMSCSAVLRCILYSV